MKRWILAVLIGLALAAVVVIVGFTQIKLDALQEPGHLETVFATQAKHLLVPWSSREGIPPAPTNLQASIEEGDKLYGTECAMCHGPDGHTAADAGRWMYPRASDLTSPAVATILRSRIVLDCKKWNSSERDARVWKGRIRRARLEFGALREDSPGEAPIPRAKASIEGGIVGRGFCSDTRESFSQELLQVARAS